MMQDYVELGEGESGLVHHVVLVQTGLESVLDLLYFSVMQGCGCR